MVRGPERLCPLIKAKGLFLAESIMISVLMMFRYFILPALAYDGILAIDIKEYSHNGNDGEDFVQCLMPAMNPYGHGDKCVLVLDNCTLHHTAGIQNICDEPYTPRQCSKIIIENS